MIFKLTIRCSGPKGRGFESRHFDTVNPLKLSSFKGFVLFAENY